MHFSPFGAGTKPDARPSPHQRSDRTKAPLRRIHPDPLFCRLVPAILIHP
jgi:hypothetical protein